MFEGLDRARVGFKHHVCTRAQVERVVIWSNKISLWFPNSMWQIGRGENGRIEINNQSLAEYIRWSTQKKWSIWKYREMREREVKQFESDYKEGEALRWLEIDEIIQKKQKIGNFGML